MSGDLATVKLWGQEPALTALKPLLRSLAWLIESARGYPFNLMASRINVRSPGNSRDRLQTLYARLWSSGIATIRNGKVELDSVLRAGVADQRRGLTLILRPGPAVRRRVAAFLSTLGALEPEQYYYAASEFHVTVLSLFTATEDPAPFLARRELYVDAMDSALRGIAPFRIEFAGVTASPGTVMIQGFLENESLNDLRDILRRQLGNRGLGAGVDQRYRLRTAHMTVVRFRSPLSHSERFAAVLEQARQRSFGATTVRSLSLVENDWYMSRRATKTVKRYRITRAP